MREYKTSDFDYDLPIELIAKNPCSIRDQSRLLVVADDLQLFDLTFNQITDFIHAGDLLVFNDSKVIKARIFGHKLTGGKIEILIERVLTNGEVIAHIRSNKTITLGLEIVLPNGLHVKIMERLDTLFKLCACVGNANIDDTFDWFAYLDEFGQIPLPPYIRRDALDNDTDNYQTVYAKNLGSVAAPTAGLHFTQELLAKIKAIGADIAHVTLHVGSGTFKPVSVTNINHHKMHSERYIVNVDTIKLFQQTKARGGKIIAVGTTSLRVLETIARDDFAVLNGETDIFITPGFKFKLVDKLITNFHLPKSTLLMLVSAFAGFDTIKTVYRHAIDNKYRFFSYGDAMLLERSCG